MQSEKLYSRKQASTAIWISDTYTPYQTHSWASFFYACIFLTRSWLVVLLPQEVLLLLLCCWILRKRVKCKENYEKLLSCKFSIFWWRFVGILLNFAVLANIKFGVGEIFFFQILVVHLSETLSNFRKSCTLFFI